MAKTFVGSRVRQLRSERGFSQAALAQMLEISPSYLNQIEHDVRPLTVAVLLRITEVFGVDATFFASEDDTRLVAELREVTMDRDVAIDVDLAEVSDMVSAHPHARPGDGQPAPPLPVDHHAVGGRDRGQILRRQRLSLVRSSPCRTRKCATTSTNDRTIFTNSIRPPRTSPFGCGCTAPNWSRELADRLTMVHGVHIKRRTDLGAHRVTPLRPGRQDTGDQWPPVLGQTVFKMAAELAYLEFGDLIDKLVEEGKFTSEESTILARLGLANYFAAATVLPYRQFHDVSENFRYDVERLSAFYSVSFETIAHRLSTLQRPSMRGVPLSSSEWTAQETCQSVSPPRAFTSPPAEEPAHCGTSTRRSRTPARSAVQIAQMPDGRNYMWVARTVERRAQRYGQPGKTFAIGLGCELRHAHRLVYSEGLDLSGENSTPIGAGCRVCERDNCPQRAFPALGRALDLDEHRSTVSPYLVQRSQRDGVLASGERMRCAIRATNRSGTTMYGNVMQHCENL